MTMTGPAELKDRMVALWASHAEWMKASHHRGGDKACLFYHQCISEEMNDFTKGRPELGARAEPTGNVTITCIEFYATKAGLDEHFKLFHAGDWKGGEEFGALMGTGKVSFLGEHPRQTDIINTVLLQSSVYQNGSNATLPREVRGATT